MKKTFTRVLSLVLVLAMFVSAVPLALADEQEVKYDSYKIVPPAEGIPVATFCYIPMGRGPLTLSAQSSPANANETLEWTSENTAVLTVDNGVITPVAAGQAAVNVKGSDGRALDRMEFVVVYIPAVAEEELTVTIGADPVALPEVTVPGLEENDYTVNWDLTEGAEYVTVENNMLTGVKEGSFTALATVTSSAYASNMIDSVKRVTVNVVERQATVYTPALSKTALEMYYGDELPLPEITGMGTLVAGEGNDYTVAWKSSAETIAKIENGKIKALGTGNATLTATITLTNDAAIFAEEKKTIELTCEVTVNSGIALEVKDPIYLTVEGTYALKAPTLKGENTEGLKVISYVYELVSGGTASTKLTSQTVSGKTNYYLTGLKTGRDVLKLTAVVKANNGQGAVVSVPALEIPVSVYADEIVITASMKSDVKTFIFTDTDKMNSLKLGSNDVLADYPSLAKLLVDLNAAHSADRGSAAALYTLHFEDLESEGGSLSNTDYIAPLYRGVALTALDGVVFTRTEGNNSRATFEYIITDDLGLPVVKGTLYIDYSDSSKLPYATDFETPITFDEDDFEAFWEEYGTTKSMNYVKFTKLPSATYGKLWTTEDKTTAVTTSMAFISDYVSGTSFYDLDAVTFVPVKKTTAYTVSIPFTAYGYGDTTGVKGTVVISVSKGTSTTVTSLGMAFGNSSYKLDDVIAADFKKNNNDEALDYLTFTLPSAKYGKLYYNFSKLLSSKLVYASDKFYYEPASNKNVYDLGKVGFIPAAGCSGNVRINYTAFGVDGTKYEGFVTLKVSTKSQSSHFTDVKSGSYAWSSDAVDFLRYHGVVNGVTETTFGPGNNITRAHFMLMLYRAFLAEDYADFKVTSNFSDIPKGNDAYSKELYQAVGVAKYLGITNGSDGKYLPNRYITREEAMTLIYRTLKELNLGLDYTSDNTTGNFSDYNKVSAYAKDPLKYLIEHGVVLGTDGKINPKSNITRAEMAVILHRVLTY